eukprot:7489044-Pyramimonas_sp.AAC.1
MSWTRKRAGMRPCDPSPDELDKEARRDATPHPGSHKISGADRHTGLPSRIKVARHTNINTSASVRMPD